MTRADLVVVVATGLGRAAIEVVLVIVVVRVAVVETVGRVDPLGTVDVGGRGATVDVGGRGASLGGCGTLPSPVVAVVALILLVTVVVVGLSVLGLAGARVALTFEANPVFNVVEEATVVGRAAVDAFHLGCAEFSVGFVGDFISALGFAAVAPDVVPIGFGLGAACIGRVSTTFFVVPTPCSSCFLASFKFKNIK